MVVKQVANTGIARGFCRLHRRGVVVGNVVRYLFHALIANFTSSCIHYIDQIRSQGFVHEQIDAPGEFLDIFRFHRVTGNKHTSAPIVEQICDRWFDGKVVHGDRLDPQIALLLNNQGLAFFGQWKFDRGHSGTA